MNIRSATRECRSSQALYTFFDQGMNVNKCKKSLDQIIAPEIGVQLGARVLGLCHSMKGRCY